MTTKVSAISPRDKFNKIWAKVDFWQGKPEFSSSASVNVFIEHTDSYAEIRKRAIEAARDLFKEVLAGEPVETPE
jgi:hypothetical protein